MILHSITKPLLFKQFRSIFLFSSHLNKTYGSINKPIGLFTKNSKLTPLEQSTISSKPESKENRSEENTPHTVYQNNEQQHSRRETSFDLKKNKQMAFFFKLSQRQQLNTIEEYRQKEMLKQLSIICKQMHFYKVQSDSMWHAIQTAFTHFLHPPYDQDKCRSISQFLHGLAKAKRHSRNYSDDMIEVLPFTSIQSFTQIVVMILRMGVPSDRFMAVVEELYYKRKDEAGLKEICLINYSLAKCGRKVDTSIADKISQYNLREIAYMMKAFDRSGNMTRELLKKCAQVVVAKKEEVEFFFDLKHLLSIYLKYQYFDNFHLWHYFDEQFRNLSSILGVINEDFIDNIWPYFPQAINKNKLPPSLVEEIVKKLGQLRKSDKIRVNKWRYIEASFNKIQNKEIREKLKKIAEEK